MLSGTENTPICTEEQRDDTTKFQSWFNGFGYRFYNELTGKYICKGPTDDGAQLVAQDYFDPNKCWMEITEENETLDSEDGKTVDFEEFQLYFSSVMPAQR